MAKNRQQDKVVEETVVETPVVEEIIESTENASDETVVVESTENAVVENDNGIEESGDPVILDEEPKDDETPPLDSDEEPEVKEEKQYDPEINLLNDASASVEDKINWCLSVAPAKLKNIALQLKSYNDTMKPGAIYDEQRMLGKQYELVSIFRSVFNSASYNEFKSKFDVLNLFFLHYSNEAFAAQFLSRFDYLWKWSDAELETLLTVSEVVSQLCNYDTRKTRLKQLNLNMALDSKRTIVSEEARNFVIKYYGK